jgi:chromosomal replication initiation ATPase DnaA
LHGAIAAALGLAQRKQRTVETGDRNALADVEHRVIRELERLAKMSKSASAIERHAGNISDEIRKGRKALEKLVEKAKATLRALDVELTDEELERAAHRRLSSPGGNTAAT